MLAAAFVLVASAPILPGSRTRRSPRRSSAWRGSWSGTTPERSSAILTSGERTRVVAVGESAFGGRLVSVATDAVVVEVGGSGGSCACRRPAAELPRAAAPARGAPARRAPRGPRDPAREMARDEVQRRLGEEIPRILAETALVPVMEDGRVVGVQVTRLPEGSLLTDAGLRTGDVLTRVNDTDIDGMASLIGLWPRLQTASELRAIVLRGGQPFSLLVSLR
jgi:general secretion pathway protein C